MEDALYLAALKYLGYRPRSEKEIRDYLKKKVKKFPDTDSSVIDIIVHKLKKQKFLNDVEFAKMWVRSRTEFKPKGWRLIKLELKQKGISEEIVKNLSFDSAQDESYATFRNEISLATQLLEKKMRKYELMGKQERFNKAGSFLARRGFDLDTIKSAIDQVFGK